MTRQCALVLHETDFPVNIYRDLEQKLTSHTPKQIVDLVWDKDPVGMHDWKWFSPFFKGYLRRGAQIRVLMDDDFWILYDRLTQMLPYWEVWDMPLLDEMAHKFDESRFDLALRMAKSLKHLYSLYVKTPKFNIPTPIVKRGVKTHGFDGSS